jgi:hypothetical protein
MLFLNLFPMKKSFCLQLGAAMEQIKSTGLVLSEKNNLVQIPIGFHVKLCPSMVAILNFQSVPNLQIW